MKITIEDLATALFVPHLTKNDDDGQMEPKGSNVLETTQGKDIGKILLEGDFESDNPYVEAMAKVFATILNRDSGDITKDAVSDVVVEKETDSDEKDVNQTEKL